MMLAYSRLEKVAQIPGAQSDMSVIFYIMFMSVCCTVCNCQSVKS